MATALRRSLAFACSAKPGVHRSRLMCRSNLIRSFSNISSAEAEHDQHSGDHTSSVLSNDNYFCTNELVKLEDLFEARVHLGHYEGALHPDMEPYIHGSRHGQHIFDLNKTVKHVQVALNVLAHIVYKHGVVLLVSTHPRYERLVQQTAREAGEYFATGYWRKGSLSNAHTLLGRHVVMPDLVVFLTMNDFLFDQSAVVEAAMCGIPSIGVVDSNCDPDLITYRIPGNDDTPSSVELYCKMIRETMARAKSKRIADDAAKEAQQLE